MASPRSLLQAPVLGVLALLAPSQDDGREVVRGRVVDRAGQPVAGAAVALISRPIPWSTAIGELDRVDVVSGKRGRFRARVLPGRTYTAWATWRDAEERPHITVPSESVRSGKLAKLVETKHTVARPRFQLQRLEAWKDRAPFTVRIHAKTRTVFSLPVELAADGRVHPPLVPSTDTYAHVTVHGRDGSAFYRRQVALTPQRRKEFGLRLPAPYDLSVRVVAAEGGEPVAGAALSWQTFDGAFARCGTTDEKGQCEVRVVSNFQGEAPHTLHLVATAEGYGAGTAGWLWGNKPYVDGVVVAEKPETWVIQLPPESAVTGKVRGADGKPLGGLTVLGSCNFVIARSESSWSSYTGPERTATTDASGVLRFSGLPKDVSGAWSACQLPQELISRQLARLPQDFPHPRSILRPFPRGSRGTRELGTFRIDRLDVVCLKLEDVDGQPARGVEVLAFPSSSPIHPSAKKRLPGRSTDRRGRVSFLCRPGETSFIAQGENGWLGLELSVAPLPGKGKAAQAEVHACKLKPYDVFAGRVTDQNGKPLTGVLISTSGWGSSGTVPFSVLVDAVNSSQFERVLTDSEGKFSIPFIAHPNRRQQVSFSIRKDKKRYRTTYRLVEPTTEAEITLEVGS